MEKAMKKLLIISASVLINITSFAANEDNLKKEKYQVCQIPLDHNSTELKATFRAIQDITHGLAAKTVEDFKAYGVELQLGVESWPGSFPHSKTTKKGLFLVCSDPLTCEDRGQISIDLKTPWGLVKVLSEKTSLVNYYASKLPIFDALNVFSKMLELSFDGIEGERVQGRKFFVLDKDGAINYEIARKKLVELYGSDERVVTNVCSDRIRYKILAIGKVPLPDPIEANSKDREYKTVEESWKTMMEQYEKEEKKELN